MAVAGGGVPRPITPSRTTGLSATSIYADARLAGFSAQDAVTATAIALAESGGNANAHNGNASTGDDSWGLWQINLLGGLRSRLQKWGLSSPSDLTDPYTNATAAYSLFKDAGGSFRDWSTYTHGTYQGYLAQARQAAQIVGDSPSTYAVKGKGLAVIGNGITGAASDAAGAVTGALSGWFPDAQSLLVKGLFVGLGVTLIGVGLVKASGVGKAVEKVAGVAL